mmetsp:Transcript_124561/g.311470  ORF Transcript_124561/g.311470 Transcript_124561/m.311470 type:complete len:201 (-) Transcript_124561:538-1140(-)
MAATLKLCCLGKDSMLRFTLKVRAPPEIPIVHACCLCQLHANPLALGELHLADVAHGALLAVPCHNLAQGDRAVCRLLFRGEGGKLLLPARWRGCHSHGCDHRGGAGRNNWWRSCCRSSLGSPSRNKLSDLGKDSVLGCTQEVWDAHHVAAVHACRLCQLYSDPLARSELDTTNVANRTPLAVPCDLLAQADGAIGSLLL